MQIRPWGFVFRLQQLLSAALLCAAPLAWAGAATLAVVGLDDDPRYQTRRLEHHYPGHPGGRPLDAVQVALDESRMALSSSGETLQAKSFSAASANDFPALIRKLQEARASYVILDLADADLTRFMALAASAIPDALFFNTSAGADSLRGAACHGNLFHTYPSDAMRADALAQFLAFHSWNQTLLLSGPTAADQQQVAAWNRAARRYGIKTSQALAFKLSADPRERDLANPRLLTNDRGHDAVVVLDSDGEFARSLPYNTQWPRPVVGAAGLVAVAWDAQWDLNGGPQLSRRFYRQAQRAMGGQDWAAWAAAKSIVALLSESATAPASGKMAADARLRAQRKLLRSGAVYIDGFKGPRLNFRPWDGQLRQPVFLSHGNGVAAVAPLEGVLHPTDVLDTLGIDEKESACKQQP